MKALIVIDFTHDFVDGKLPVGEAAVAIQHTVAELTRRYVEQQDFVVMAVDLHEENEAYHPEAKLFPPHNLRGTEGRNLFGALESAYKENKEQIYWMDKSRYSAFCGTDLDVKLRERGIREISLIGVCTDICVLHTAVDAYNLGYNITVYKDAVASFNAAGHDWALTHFEGTLGARVINSN
ncbi:cysteine hydrolase [Paenibacillus sp. F411]|uniref:Isochorismatase hydrolase n=1 Tax=Paenibacillus algicola TaxID=2565926 RepID=A0A4P8XL08_9BACL|nr:MULTISPECIES: isochorismatase family cysteine hydrolase [Paenibacillus]MBO2944158.1 cysteine hydrolase [Paenibacillus sp. F411]QCT03128.1 isochorismatase hydrolase [Paenibacillus algicola]